MSHDDPDDIAYNPFAEERDHYSPGSNLTQGHYSSAFFPKLSNSRPTLRLRRSSSTDQPSISDDEDRKKHTRTRSELQAPPKSAGLHPLKSALAGINSPVRPDLGITRPYLSRLVNEGNLLEGPSVESGTSDKGLPSPEEEKDVLVHHVTSKDSLAGVSLKYGISLANLRRANQLWTSDTIHRRNVLYIPIDQAARAREYIPQFPLSTLTPDFHDETTDAFETSATSPSPERENSESVPPGPSVAIRRIPASQLSYFPPSTHILSDPRLDEQAADNTPYPQTAKSSRSSPGYNRLYTSSPASNSLSSILTALPIAASTRDEIITRLSFDSVSSSFSDRSRATSEEDGHELYEVKRPQQLHLDDDNGMNHFDELTMPTPKALHRPTLQRLSRRNDPAASLSSALPRPSFSNSHSHSSMSPPRFYVSKASETFVRTSQLEPSPAMQLPNFRSSTVGRSAGKRIQENAGPGLERTGSLRLQGQGRRATIRAAGTSDLTLETIKTNGPR